MKKSTRHQAAAVRVAAVIRKLAAFLPEKVHAYGAAHEVQPHLWRILLAPYRNGSTYQIPSHIVMQIPRLTRCLDRVLRIVNAPAEGDLMGESPWLDLAGDAIAGQAFMDALDQANNDISTGGALPGGALHGGNAIISVPPSVAVVDLGGGEAGKVERTVSASDATRCAKHGCNEPALGGKSARHLWCSEHTPDGIVD